MRPRGRSLNRRRGATAELVGRSRGMSSRPTDKAVFDPRYDPCDCITCREERGETPRDRS